MDNLYKAVGCDAGKSPSRVYSLALAVADGEMADKLPLEKGEKD